MDRSRGGPGWREEREVFVYFDNDVKVRAPVDAMGLAERLGVGWEPDALGGAARGRGL